MSKSAAKCAFCEKRGSLTKGHVWPKWLNQILPQTATHHEQETGLFYTFTPAVRGPEYAKRTKQGSARSRRPRNTCLRCNSGWMSSIEDMAIPSAMPLIENRFALLNSFHQTTVSALLCLIAMRMEFLGIMRAVTPQDRDWLRYYREPSSDWRIWIARYNGERPEDNPARFYTVQLGSHQTDKVGAEYCNVQIVTLVLGELCTHSIYSPVIDLDQFGYEGITLTSIWPPTRFEIDTRFLPTVDDKAVLWLHEAFARESPPLPTA
jgi:hypothetical protein